MYNITFSITPSSTLPTPSKKEKEKRNKEREKKKNSKNKSTHTYAQKILYLPKYLLAVGDDFKEYTISNSPLTDKSLNRL